jgi:two-component system sensor histidine kinase KdpD
MGAVARGTLHIYLGAAPGVGKTFAMLGEAHRRGSRGTDIVVGLVETHGRRRTAEQLDGLEVLPRREVTHRGVALTELDVDAVLARHPEVVVVDELAHTNAPGSRNPKRWQDVDEILDAGIHVLTTVDIAHLESLTDVVEQVTGSAQEETVPDAVVRRAEQIELVDTTPEALRRRLAHGNVHPPERVDVALSNYFRVGDLTALRELALLWLADRVDEGLRRYRAEHHIDSVWETRERVVVALTGGPEGETLIRRASRVAQRSGGELLAVHVLSADGPTGASPAALRAQRELVESLGGTYHEVVGDDVAQALLACARGVNATQLVIGTSRRSRWARAVRRGIGGQVIADSREIDVHIVTHGAAGSRGWRLPPLTGALTARRRWMGALLAVVGVPVLITLCLAADASLSIVLPAFLLLVVAIALIGGPVARAGGRGARRPGGELVLRPSHEAADRAPHRRRRRAAGRTRRGRRGGHRRGPLCPAGHRGHPLPGGDGDARLAGPVRTRRGPGPAQPAGTDPRGVRPAVGDDGGAHRRRRGAVGTCGRPGPVDDEAETVVITDTLGLRLRGRTLAASERRVLVAFAEQAAVALQQGRLAAQATEADRLAAGNSMRSALLAAVGHDLRTPLAGIKAAVSALRSDAIDLDDADRTELTATTDEFADRLTDLVENLLDMSRLQAGVVSPAPSPSDVPAVVYQAVSGLDAAERARVERDWPGDPPPVLADPGLLEWVVANLMSNAVHHAPGGPVTVSAGVVSDRVELRVVDRGPGVPLADRDRVFAPFQRLGDAPAGQGVGLGLAVARGLTEAMSGTVTAEDTPGGA